MSNEGILAQAKGRYTIKDVEQQQVEVVSVLEVEELNTLVDEQVQAQVAALTAEVARLKAQLAEAQGGGLEQAAAEAALEAEAAALEAKAAAEQRAEAAEAQVAELTQTVSQLETQLGGIPATIPPEPAEEAKSETPAEPQGITDDDHSRARRLAETLIQDVIDEEEDDAQAALKDGTFREKFSSELAGVKRTYDRRTPDEVTAEQDHWEEVLAALEAEHKAG